MSCHARRGASHSAAPPTFMRGFPKEKKKKNRAPVTATFLNAGRRSSPPCPQFIARQVAYETSAGHVFVCGLAHIEDNKRCSACIPTPNHHWASRHRLPIHRSCATVLTNFCFIGLVLFRTNYTFATSRDRDRRLYHHLFYDHPPSCHTTGMHSGLLVLAPNLLGIIRRLPPDLVCLPTTRDARPAHLLTLPRQARVRQYRVRSLLLSGISLRVRTNIWGGGALAIRPTTSDTPLRHEIDNAGWSRGIPGRGEDKIWNWTA